MNENQYKKEPAPPNIISTKLDKNDLLSHFYCSANIQTIILPFTFTLPRFFSKEDQYPLTLRRPFAQSNLAQDPSERIWIYIDEKGNNNGPFTTLEMDYWDAIGRFSKETVIGTTKMDKLIKFSNFLEFYLKQNKNNTNSKQKKKQYDKYKGENKYNHFQYQSQQKEKYEPRNKPNAKRSSFNNNQEPIKFVKSAEPKHQNQSINTSVGKQGYNRTELNSTNKSVVEQELIDTKLITNNVNKNEQTKPETEEEKACRKSSSVKADDEEEYTVVSKVVQKNRKSIKEIIKESKADKRNSVEVQNTSFDSMDDVYNYQSKRSNSDAAKEIINKKKSNVQALKNEKRGSILSNDSKHEAETGGEESYTVVKKKKVQSISSRRSSKASNQANCILNEEESKDQNILSNDISSPKSSNYNSVEKQDEVISETSNKVENIITPPKNSHQNTLIPEDQINVQNTVEVMRSLGLENLEKHHLLEPNIGTSPQEVSESLEKKKKQRKHRQRKKKSKKNEQIGNKDSSPVNKKDEISNSEQK